MSSIKTIAITFCTLLIIIGFILKMLPRGPLDKNMKTVISLVLLLVLVSPFTKNFTSANIDTPSTTFSSSEQKDPDAIFTAAVNEFKTRVENELENAGYSFSEVSVNYTKTGDTIAINKITITVPGTKNHEKIKKIIRDKFLAPVTVIEDG